MRPSESAEELRVTGEAAGCVFRDGRAGVAILEAVAAARGASLLATAADEAQRGCQ